MSKKQATGVDTRAMLPLYVSLFVSLCASFFPWISIPVLKYSQLPVTYTFWEMEQCVKNIQTSIEMGGRMRMELFEAGELEMLHKISMGLKGAAGLLILFMVLCGVLSYTMKKKSLGYVRFAFVWSSLMAVAAFCCIGAANLFINERMGRESNFINLTIHSYIQLTAWQYAQLILSVLMLIWAGKLLDTQAEYEVQKYIERSVKKDRGVGKRTLTAMVLILVAIPFVIFFGIFFLNDRSEIFISLCIIGLAMIPFFMVFEERKPQAREILLIAVMAAIAVAGRMAFFMLPQFKPVAAIVILAGVGLGAEAGFLTGAMAGLCPTLFRAGTVDALADVFLWNHRVSGRAFVSQSRKKKRQPEKGVRHKILLCIYGGAVYAGYLRIFHGYGICDYGGTGFVLAGFCSLLCHRISV